MFILAPINCHWWMCCFWLIARTNAHEEPWVFVPVSYLDFLDKMPLYWFIIACVWCGVYALWWVYLLVNNFCLQFFLYVYDNKESYNYFITTGRALPGSAGGWSIRAKKSESTSSTPLGLCFLTIQGPKPWGHSVRGTDVFHVSKWFQMISQCVKGSRRCLEVFTPCLTLFLHLGTPVAWSFVSGDNLFSTLKLSRTFFNPDLRHLRHSLDPDCLPVPETLWSSSYPKPLPAIPNTTMCSFHPSTSPDTSKGCSKTSASSKGNSEISSDSTPCSNYRVKIGTVGIKNLEYLANRNSSVTVRTPIHW